MRKCIVLLVFLIPNILLAQTADQLFENANSLYKEGKYIDAIKVYKQLESSKNVVCSEVYFNLANAYHKLHKVAPAIYNYEKALQLNPLNSDAQNNLKIAKRLTLDRIEELPLTFLQRINYNVLQKFTYNTWAIFVVILSFLASILFVFYYFSYTPSKKKVFFATSTTSFLLLIITLSITYFQYNQSKNKIEAIVFSEKMAVKNAPTNDADRLFTLHQGTKVLVIDTVDNWNKIKLSDGKTGWVISGSIKLLHNY
ncbi:tetratricopeptide repeat protein [Tenacibaculum finnmarkense]|uniref:tetratricopeptide repeat protein n=1 Tax=Tenacibaculum finnmarkense TaxID=2781243 RepID=UPI00187B4890|nr:tetratricopeptide repeat protein [Tenacibaculum finnmarkense]MBE7687010.1 tetratricopeptide repeat protein [Tenacibaculum finnmarkense genomovar ulcerans]MCG8882265.1 tetratricopeptide repeat protein [Tenacibaculum finnmarkense]WCC42330.1 tetratricopeptide repeat protein [Tenacibaculum finnmarkense]